MVYEKRRGACGRFFPRSARKCLKLEAVDLHVLYFSGWDGRENKRDKLSPSWYRAYRAMSAGMG